ncbi:uncharacterized protein BDZ83DRAFT_712727 [Colletotrichum acutatum]|uniref:F-box domain-containing protein n=1 Tax=Glomerella acutata TaxID=27357 RepID=A0AAD8UAM6_GLOAC|nr:uncharacterized protein BDZ83DRAFT_712727 [Colletotrichum acutatum]KAK1707549.1 hypothetical protein BDZ83DRAFT_712727 [Colletotrichum acutatum]
MVTIRRCLGDLPPELTQQIASNISPSSLLDFRQTCKRFNTETLDHFIKHFFTTRCFILERRSLENLVEISRHDVFGPAVHRLHVVLNHISTKHETLMFNDSFALFEVDPGPNWEAHQRFLDEQSDMASTGLDIAYLSAAMANFINCRAIYVMDWGSSEQESPPWGLSQLENEIRFELEPWVMRPSGVVFAKRAIVALLSAVIGSRLALERLRIDLAHFPFTQFSVPSSLPHTALCIPQLLAIRTPDALRHVSTLHLLLSSEHMEDIELGLVSNGWASDVADFIHLFPSVSDLTLQVHTPREDSNYINLWEISTIYIPVLKSLVLSGFEGEGGDLVDLLRRHGASLNDLDLGNINLVQSESNWSDIVQVVRDELGDCKIQITDCEFEGQYLEIADYSCADFSSFIAFLQATTREELTELHDKVVDLEI